MLSKREIRELYSSSTDIQKIWNMFPYVQNTE